MKKGFTTIDEYIASYPEATHERLQAIRAEVKRIAPEAKEKISYQIGAFELNSEGLLAFAGWKNHFSIYPIPSGGESFNKEIAQYVDGKGTLKFPLDKPLPMKLIEQVIELHVVENRKRTGK